MVTDPMSAAGNPRRTPSEAREQVRKWNAEHPVGTVVMFTSAPGCVPVATRTRAQAAFLAMSVAVVWCEDMTACVSLDSVRLMTAEEEAERQRIVDEWNAANPVGTRVTTKHDDPDCIVQTTEPAALTARKVPAVRLGGRDWPLELLRIVPAEPPTPAQEAPQE